MPIVVMAHGFSATRDQRLDAYAERFAAAGLGVLLFDYRHFGASGGEPRQLLDIRRQHADYRAAIAYARTLPWVDGDRVALFGSSFSGGHVIALAAADPSIAAVVSQCPFTDSFASLPKLGPANAVRATVAGLRDEVRARTGRAPAYIPPDRPTGNVRGHEHPGRGGRVPGDDGAGFSLGEPRCGADRAPGRRLPAGPGRRAPALPGPVLHLRQGLGRAGGSHRSPRRRGGSRRDQALSGRPL